METIQIFMWILYGFLLGQLGPILVKFLFVELPVTMKLKREQLYDRWKYPNLNGRDKK